MSPEVQDDKGGSLGHGGHCPLHNGVAPVAVHAPQPTHGATGGGGGGGDAVSTIVCLLLLHRLQGTAGSVSMGLQDEILGNLWSLMNALFDGYFNNWAAHCLGWVLMD